MDEKPSPNPDKQDSRQKGTEPLALPPPRQKQRQRLVALVVAGLVLILVIAAGFFVYIKYIEPYETTDDAFIAGNVPYVSARVPGPVVRLLVDDNQRVKVGDLILEIDDSDYQTQLAQAQANLVSAKDHVLQAKAQIAVDEAKAKQQQDAIAGAQAVADRARADEARYKSVESNAVSRTQVDLAQTTAVSTSSSVEVARDQAKAAAAQVDLDRADLETAISQVTLAEASLRQAELNLSYTKVLAPATGRITHRTVEQGAYISVGQSLLAIVPDNVWVVANFKETQLKRIRPGQPVSVEIDAYPSRKFKAKVDSLQAGSGANFSLLPPENAVGNYVKVVQRVPIKIVFDEPLNQSDLDIAPGMSVEPKVTVK